MQQIVCVNEDIPKCKSTHPACNPDLRSLMRSQSQKSRIPAQF
ncbi:uncharacterized protein RAG0_05365 [Rhynchosporium agropyri]|uniref:Uncharacterized protein n=2 Tax=Rhynchosporium TaxID=38037 RepID=A0A1E1LV60_RHYSE|nr:uncharacterized protein RAG0_05365 [Rhynchosporium agropyri]CZT40741.1 uncharacterized protein RSE6_00389 [Rhynchosporium secalis]